MGRRREQRIAINLPIIVRGQDALGNPFRQSARTLDISSTGARIDGVFCLSGSGVPVEIEYKGQRASYSVKWIGAAGIPQAGQIGVRSLSPDKNVWKEQVPAPGADPYIVAPRAQPAVQKRAAAAHVSVAPSSPAPSGAERRRYSRQQCRVSAQIVAADGQAKMNGTITDISLGGCFVEMLSPLPVNTDVILTTNALDGTLFTTRAVIRMSLPGMGIGIEFTAMSDQDRIRLTQLAPQSEALISLRSAYSSETPLIEASPIGSNGANGSDHSAAMEDAFNAIVRVLIRKGLLTESEIEEEANKLKAEKRP